MTLSPVGTPLEMWPVITPAQVQALKAVNIFTVEQLVGVADSALHLIPFGRTLQNQGKAWLISKKDADAVENARRETDSLRDGLRQMEDLIAAQNAKIAELTAQRPQVTGQEQKTAISPAQKK